MNQEHNMYLQQLQVKVKEGAFKNITKGQLKEPRQLVETFKSLKDWGQSTVLAVYLNESKEMLMYDILSTGTQSATLIDPKDLYGHAYMVRAMYYVLVVNYISGATQPSETDKEFIAFLQGQTHVMNTEMLDFIIVGQEGYWSLHEENNPDPSYPVTNSLE